MRRTILGWIHKKDINRCSFCGKALTEEEQQYYQSTCKACEKELLKRISDDSAAEE